VKPVNKKLKFYQAVFKALILLCGLNDEMEKEKFKILGGRVRNEKGIIFALILSN
jgi:hypothetical protein